MTAQTHLSKGECKMKFPTSIATWFMIVFFLLVAIAAFTGFNSAIINGIVALGAAVFLFLGK